MIAYIKGEVAWIEEERIVLESGNIGYNIMMPASSFDTQDLVGKEVKIYTHLNVREDAMQLYGFLNLDELKTFRLLLGVNGIGPKAAIGILSGLTTDELRFAVLSDDVKTISKAPGIGKKTAQKLILELKDKIDLEEVFETKQEHVRETEGCKKRCSRCIDSAWIFEYRSTACSPSDRGDTGYGCGNNFEISVKKYEFVVGKEDGKKNHNNRCDRRGLKDRGKSSTTALSRLYWSGKSKRKSESLYRGCKTEK